MNIIFGTVQFALDNPTDRKHMAKHWIYLIFLTVLPYLVPICLQQQTLRSSHVTMVLIYKTPQNQS